MDSVLKKNIPRNITSPVNILSFMKLQNMGECYKRLEVPCYAFKCKICTFCYEPVSMNLIFLVKWWSWNAFISFFLVGLITEIQVMCIWDLSILFPRGEKVPVQLSHKIHSLHDMDIDTCISWKVFMFPLEFIVRF